MAKTTRCCWEWLKDRNCISTLIAKSNLLMLTLVTTVTARDLHNYNAASADGSAGIE